jgi:O-antigen/teichoic acid export membrane protein
VIVARRSEPAEYGAFAVAFAAFLFLAGFHQALFLEPMSVLSARREQAGLDEYLSQLAALHFVLTVPSGLAVACTLLVPGIDRGAASGAVLGLAAALPIILLLWLTRAACYLKGRPRVALGASAAYALCLLGGLGFRIAVVPERPIRSHDAFLVMAGASLVAALVGWTGLALRRPQPRGLRPLLREHWSYGRFILAASVAHGVSTLAVAPLLGLLAGLAQTGAFRALQNLTAPLQQALAAATLLGLPSLSRQEAAGPPAAFRRSAGLLIRATVVAAAAYAAALVLLGPACLRLAYGTSIYAGLGWALVPLAATLVPAGLAQALGIVLRAARRPDAVMWSKGAGAVAVVAIGWVAIRAYGLQGALYALLGSTLAEAVVLLLAYQRLASKTPMSSGSITRP